MHSLPHCESPGLLVSIQPSTNLSSDPLRVKQEVPGTPQSWVRSWVRHRVMSSPRSWVKHWGKSSPKDWVKRWGMHSPMHWGMHWGKHWGERTPLNGRNPGMSRRFNGLQQEMA